MKAVLVDEKRKKLVIGECQTPVPKKNEVLLQVKATALNRADLLQKRGLYPPPPGASPILGLEASGVVVKCGADVKRWKEGDRVFALLAGGGYAEYAVIPEDMLMPIPASFSFEEAAAIPEVFLTAYLNLFELGKLKKNDWVLVHAGASGVGTAAIQLIRAAGALSIVTAGTEEKRQFCRSLGAVKAIDYKAGPFAPKVKDVTDNEGVHVILDFIGAPYWEQNISCLRNDGRLIIIGTMGGTKVQQVNLGALLRRRLQVIGTALRSRPPKDKAVLTEKFRSFAFPLFEKGELKPVIDSIWNMEDVNEAHEKMERNENIGKIVLRIAT